MSSPHQAGRDVHVAVLRLAAAAFDALHRSRRLGRLAAWRAAADRARQRIADLTACRACGADPYELDHLAVHGPPVSRRASFFVG